MIPYPVFQRKLRLRLLLLSPCLLLCLGAFLQVTAEFVDARKICIPGKHDARRTSDKAIEPPSAFADPIKQSFRCFKKCCIGLNGACEPHTWNVRDLLSEVLRTLIGV